MPAAHYAKRSNIKETKYTEIKYPAKDPHT